MKTKLTGMIQSARKRQDAHYLCGFINTYCENPECTARQISIKIKTYGADDPVRVSCPLCGKPTIFDRHRPPVETLGEYLKRTERESRADERASEALKMAGRRSDEIRRRSTF